MSATRDAVNDRYRAAAQRMERADGGGCCDGDDCCGAFYSADELGAVGVASGVSLGCGNPLALAGLRPGEVVVDLGSGAGIDVLLSARRVAPDGHAYGVDMTDEMLALADRSRERAGIGNATFLKGTIEGNYLALADASRAKEVLAKELKIADSKVLDVTYDDFRAQSPANCEISLAGAANILGQFPGGSQTVTDYVDTSLLEAVREDGFFAAMERKYRR